MGGCVMMDMVFVTAANVYLKKKKNHVKDFAVG